MINLSTDFHQPKSNRLKLVIQQRLISLDMDFLNQIIATMVHAYTPRAMQRAVEAGVKSIEHGQMLDEETLKILAKKGVWLSLQNLMDNNENMDEQRKEKRKPVLDGQDKVWPLAKKLGVKLAWGTDFLFEPELNDDQNSYILRLQKWFTNAEILKMVTQDNGELHTFPNLQQHQLQLSFRQKYIV